MFDLRRKERKEIYLILLCSILSSLFYLVFFVLSYLLCSILSSLFYLVLFVLSCLLCSILFSLFYLVLWRYYLFYLVFFVLFCLLCSILFYGDIICSKILLDSFLTPLLFSLLSLFTPSFQCSQSVNIEVVKKPFRPVVNTGYDWFYEKCSTNDINKL